MKSLGCLRQGVGTSLGAWLALAAALTTSPVSHAQNYTLQQVLHATASGEGEAYVRFGTQLAVDDGLLVVSEHNGDHTGRTRLRAYRQLAGTWERAAELTINDNTEGFHDLALSQGILIYSTKTASGGAVQILRDTGSGWDQEFSFSSPQFNEGVSVAIAGTRAVIGQASASNDAGAVFVIQRASNGGGWDITTTLTPDTPQAGAGFGSSVAIVSGAVVAGAPLEDVLVSGNPVSNAGAGYVFELTQSTWHSVNRLTAPTPQQNAWFGRAVAISGLDEGTPDRLLISSRENTADGRVYGYKRGANAWGPSPSFTVNPPGNPTGSEFGARLSMDGDYALIGAYAFTASGNVSAGAAYGMDFNSTFTGATRVALLDPSPQENAELGIAVAIDRQGPTSFIGAPGVNLHGNSNQGVVLSSEGSTAQPFPPLTRSLDLGQGLTGALFGKSISASGDLLLVGAPEESVGNTERMGAAYLYRRQGDGQYALETRWQSPQGVASDFFGSAVAVQGDLALVGAMGVDLESTDSGLVYVYRHAAGSWTLEAQLFSNCASTERRFFGRRIAFDGIHAMIGGICPPVESGGPTADVGVRIFTRQVDGSWQHAVANGSFRMGSGAFENGFAVIGEPASSGSAGSIEAGFVRPFVLNGNVWQLSGPSDNGSNTPSPQGYGHDLDLDRGLLAVASLRDNTPVLLRRRSGNAFLPETSLLIDGLSPTESTRAVAVHDERIAIGAQSHTVSIAEQGAVFLFEKRSGTWQQAQRLLSDQPQEDALFGDRLVFSDDGRLIVSATQDSGDFIFEGAVYIFSPPPDAVFGDGFE